MNQVVNQVEEQDNEELEELNQKREAIKDVCHAILDGESSKENQVLMLKGLREKINKQSDILGSVYEVVIDTARDALAETVEIDDKYDLQVLREAVEIFRIIAKKGNEQEVSYTADTIFQCLESSVSSKRHQLELLKVLNFTMDKNPEVAEQFVDRVISVSKSNILKAASSCDSYDKEIVEQATAAIESVGDYGMDIDNNALTQVAVNGLSEVVNRINPDMSNDTRRAMFNRVAQPIVEFIEADPYFYKKVIRSNIFDSMSRFEFNSKSIRRNDKIKENVEQVKEKMDNAFTKAIVKNLKKA